MKSLIKYPFGLFILFLIGYSQLSISHNETNFPHYAIKNGKEAAHIQAHLINNTEVGDFYIEEQEEREDEQNAEEAYFSSEFNKPTFFNYTDSRFSSWEFKQFSFFRSPYLAFCVLRL